MLARARCADPPSEYADARFVSDWTVRPAVKEDEPCIIPMWVKQLVRGTDARGAGFQNARVRGSDEFAAYYEVYQPIIEGLVRSGVSVVVACDPERATYEPGRPAVIHAWAVLGGDIVYGIGIKRDSARAGFGGELARLLLGDALDRPMRTVLDIVDIKVPRLWRRERGWAASLRQISERRLSEDSVFAAVTKHIIDPAREPWVPNEQRAA